MKGYGHFVPALFCSLTYWLSISAFLGVISIAFARRGADDSRPARFRMAAAGWPCLIPAAAICLLVTLASGTWYFYNAHILNEYLNAKARRQIQADYERDFKKYENFPQPKVTAVDTKIDIDPERRSFSGSGHYTLQNKIPNLSSDEVFSEDLQPDTQGLYAAAVWSPELRTFPATA